jgi:hypothetical protein
LTSIRDTDIPAGLCAPRKATSKPCLIGRPFYRPRARTAAPPNPAATGLSMS